MLSSSQIVNMVDILGVQIICWNGKKSVYVFLVLLAKFSCNFHTHHFENKIKNKFEMKELKCETMVVNIPNAFSLLNIMHILSIFVSRSQYRAVHCCGFFRAQFGIQFKNICKCICTSLSIWIFSTSVEAPFYLI